MAGHKADHFASSLYKVQTTFLHLLALLFFDIYKPLFHEKKACRVISIRLLLIVDFSFLIRIKLTSWFPANILVSYSQVKQTKQRNVLSTNKRDNKHEKNDGADVFGQ